MLLAICPGKFPSQFPRRGLPIHWKEFEKFVLHVGCRFVREKGDHRVYWREGLLRPVVIPHRRDLPEFIIKNNLRVLGIDRKQFQDILKSI